MKYNLARAPGNWRIVDHKERILWIGLNKKEFKYYTDYIAYNNGPDTSFKDAEIIYYHKINKLLFPYSSY